MSKVEKSKRSVECRVLYDWEAPNGRGPAAASGEISFQFFTISSFAYKHIIIQNTQKAKI